MRWLFTPPQLPRAASRLYKMMREGDASGWCRRTPGWRVAVSVQMLQVALTCRYPRPWRFNLAIGNGRVNRCELGLFSSWGFTSIVVVAGVGLFDVWRLKC